MGLQMRLGLETLHMSTVYLSFVRQTDIIAYTGRWEQDAYLGTLP